MTFTYSVALSTGREPPATHIHLTHWEGTPAKHSSEWSPCPAWEGLVVHPQQHGGGAHPDCNFPVFFHHECLWNFSQHKISTLPWFDIPWSDFILSQYKSAPLLPTASCGALHFCYVHLLTHRISLRKCQGTAGAESSDTEVHMGTEDHPSTSHALTNRHHPTWPEHSQQPQAQ